MQANIITQWAHLIWDCPASFAECHRCVLATALLGNANIWTNRYFLALKSGFDLAPHVSANMQLFSEVSPSNALCRIHTDLAALTALAAGIASSVRPHRFGYRLVRCNRDRSRPSSPLHQLESPPPTLEQQHTGSTWLRLLPTVFHALHSWRRTSRPSNGACSPGGHARYLHR